MFVSILVGMLIMCVILFFELIIEPKIRLTWPYGDLVPGSYLSKISLQVYCSLIALFIVQKKITKIIPGIVSLISLVMIFFTGERTNFIIRLFSGLLVFFSWKLNKKFFILAVIFTSFLILIFTQILKNSNSKLIERYTSHF